MTEKFCLSVDLDETMGDFDSIGPPFAQSRRETKINNPPKLRPHLAETLELLIRGGCRIAVTSGRSIYPLLIALEEGELTDFVDKPFCGESLNYNPRKIGKDYKQVINHFNLNPQQALSNMLVIGDREADIPENTSELVFIYQPEGHLTTADLWKQIIEVLLEKGGGSFREGYEKIVKSGQQIAEVISFRQATDTVKYNLSNNTDLYLGTLVRGSIRTPTIMPVLH